MSNALQKWERADNYAGAEFYDYFLGPARTRDSQDLENSNFEVALERLGGESKKGVIVVRSGHWACGWVEQILVHKTAKAKLRILEQMQEDLTNYPILDEEEYNDRQHASLVQYVDDIYSYLTKEERSKFLDAVFNLGLEYNDNDGSIFIREKDENRAFEYAHLEETGE